MCVINLSYTKTKFIKLWEPNFKILKKVHYQVLGTIFGNLGNSLKICIFSSIFRLSSLFNSFLKFGFKNSIILVLVYDNTLSLNNAS